MHKDLLTNKQTVLAFFNNRYMSNIFVILFIVDNPSYFPKSVKCFARLLSVKHGKQAPKSIKEYPWCKMNIFSI